MALGSLQEFCRHIRNGISQRTVLQTRHRGGNIAKVALCERISADNRRDNGCQRCVRRCTQVAPKREIRRSFLYVRHVGIEAFCQRPWPVCEKGVPMAVDALHTLLDKAKHLQSSMGNDKVAMELL